MVESMTGFGRCERSDEHGTVLVEARSVNGRYLKVQSRLPELLLSREADIESLVRSRVSRGTVSVTIHLKPAGSAAAWRINTEVVQAYAEALESLRLQMRHGVPIRLETLAALPGAMEPADQPDLGESVWPLTAGALDEALDGMLQMRRTEGEALAQALVQHAEHMHRSITAVAERAPRVLADWRDRLRARVDELAADVGTTVNDADLAREVVLFTERSDVTEELNRLRSHLDQFRLTLQGETSAGRTLEFLAQEMLREANTIAAKANDADIAQQAVLIKGELDRIKEQIQNVA